MAGWKETKVALADGQEVTASVRVAQAVRITVRQDDARMTPMVGDRLIIDDMAALVTSVTDPGGRGETWDIVATVTEV